MLNNNKAEFALSDMDLASILELVPGNVYWKNLNSVYLGCNQNLATLTGFENKDEIIGKTDYELVDSAIAGKYIKDDQYVIKTGKQLIVEDRTGIKNSKGLEVILRTEKSLFWTKKVT
ncbi:MAG: Sensory box histidine kinase/response regulator [Solimicrobium sp.]|jgi:PAS domain-containing protein|nr:Sensory box histidine kinase/response regulator [Solimicrobium sp.]